MRTTKIKIKNLFGITETELDGTSVEISGTNGIGKTSVIDAIRYALTNSSERDYIIRNGASEGEIIVETDTGVTIARKKRTGKADYKSVKENGREVQAPESFLSQFFTPLQLNPVAFTQMSKQEQNRIILDLIEFDWDLNWIREQFGEIPTGVNYEQNILQVLNDIQSENGDYFQRRQDVNRDIRNKRAFIADISKDIPDGYQAEYWEKYDLGAAYKKLTDIQTRNAQIARAKSFLESYSGKMRGLQAELEISIANAEKALQSEKEEITAKIEEYKKQIAVLNERLSSLDSTLEDKKAIAESEYREKVAKLDSDSQIAREYAEQSQTDTSELSAEISTAEQMKRHLNEYHRMQALQAELEDCIAISSALTMKIELARSLPGEILKTATIPVEGLTVEDGIPLIHGLPVSNLSEGEKLDLCIDVTISKPAALQIILIDGAEKLSDANRERLYKKCREKGLQFVATRTSDSDEMVVTNLE